MKELIIKKNTYQDSFNLMLLSEHIRGLAGVHDVAIFMGTPANKKRLLAAGFEPESLAAAGPSDLCIGLDVADKDRFVQAEQEVRNFLLGNLRLGAKSGGGEISSPRSLEGALRALPGANIVSISLPGEYATREARKALEMGLHVFLFSDNVPVEEEIELKQLAHHKGLLLMGPDCGTARLGTASLGFCNVTTAGQVGIVAASGTGAQELMCLLSDLNIGISHVIGTGGRDLNQKVGGITSTVGLHALETDEKTKVIIYVSKPAPSEVEEHLLAAAERITKPVIFCFVGRDTGAPVETGKTYLAQNLSHAAQQAAALLRGNEQPAPLKMEQFEQQHQEKIQKITGSLLPEQKYIRGLYSGGTLADESAQIISQIVPDVYANHEFLNVHLMEDWDNSKSHTVIDLGEDRFTQGRPHPMIDLRTRFERFHKEVSDPQVAVVLLDFVLGLNAHPDPGTAFAEQVQVARLMVDPPRRFPVVIAHVCGTDQDPQDRKKQVRALEQAGCWVFTSNVEAAMAAAATARRQSKDA